MMKWKPLYLQPNKAIPWILLIAALIATLCQMDEANASAYPRQQAKFTVNQNEVTLTISHDKTEGVNWDAATWDLQRTNAQGLVKTLCGGKAILKKDVTRAD